MVVIRYHIQNPSEKRNPFSLMIRTERAISIKGTEAISKKIMPRTRLELTHRYRN